MPSLRPRSVAEGPQSAVARRVPSSLRASCRRGSCGRSRFDRDFYPFRPGISLGFYAGYPGFYGYPYAYPYGYYGYPYDGYPGYYGGYGYMGVGPGRAYGGVRIQGAARDAQVYVDGYYAGVVDDFDGTFQHLNLEPGAHRVEIRGQNAPPLAFDVNVRPGETITYRADR